MSVTDPKNALVMQTRARNSEGKVGLSTRQVHHARAKNSMRRVKQNTVQICVFVHLSHWILGAGMLHVSCA